MTKKRGILLAVIAAAAVAWTVRYVTMNAYMLGNYSHLHAYYQQGEPVEFGDNYIYFNCPQVSGYAISVESARIVDYRDYCEEYGIAPDPDQTVEEILELTCHIWNNGSQAEGVPLDSFHVHGTNWFLNTDITLLMGTLDGANGAYVDDGEMGTVHIPFDIADGALPPEIRKGLSGGDDCYLALTAFPTVLDIQFAWPE